MIVELFFIEEVNFIVRGSTVHHWGVWRFLKGLRLMQLRHLQNFSLNVSNQLFTCVVAWGQTVVRQQVLVDVCQVTGMQLSITVTIDDLERKQVLFNNGSTSNKPVQFNQKQRQIYLTHVEAVTQEIVKPDCQRVVSVHKHPSKVVNDRLSRQIYRAPFFTFGYLFKVTFVKSQI